VATRRPSASGSPPRYDGGAGLSGAVTSHAQRGTRLHCTRRRAGGSAAAPPERALPVGPPSLTNTRANRWGKLLVVSSSARSSDDLAPLLECCRFYLFIYFTKATARMGSGRVMACNEWADCLVHRRAAHGCTPTWAGVYSREKAPNDEVSGPGGNLYLRSFFLPQPKATLVRKMLSWSWNQSTAAFFYRYSFFPSTREEEKRDCPGGMGRSPTSRQHTVCHPIRSSLTTTNQSINLFISWKFTTTRLESTNVAPPRQLMCTTDLF
jgi:hypothetical protein